MYLQLIILLLSFASKGRAEKCTTPNNEQGECIPLHSCTVLYEALTKEGAAIEQFIEKSVCGASKFVTKVCCGSSFDFRNSTTKSSTPAPIENVTKKSLLASRTYCGYQHSDDYSRPENDTSIRITEFPWLARIKHNNTRSGQFLYACSGALINTRYVLTAAHCQGNSYLIPIEVRLGEFHAANQTDCIREQQFEEECSDAVEDFGIERIIPHMNYSIEAHFNDICLIRLNKSVTYSDYIRPICLPLAGTVFAKAGDIIATSGWGKNFSGGSVEFKKKIFSRIITNEECIRMFDSKAAYKGKVNITENQMCNVQLSNNTDLECVGDGGGPGMFSHRHQWQLESIISFGSAICEDKNIPEVHTRVANYIEWIEENLLP